MKAHEMNNMLLEYSRIHLSQAQGSLFTMDPLKWMLQYDSLTTFGNQVLQGHADLHSIGQQPPMKVLLLHLCDKTIDPEACHHPINYKELQNGIKKWLEKITTSPSGCCHLGIYKSLQQHTVNKKDQPPLPLNVTPLVLTQGQDILYLIFDIMSLALQHMHTLQCWKMVWMMFIKKDLGNPDLNLLHCIMIFKADWQLLLKWHSSYDFLPKSEQAHALTPVQGGGCKGCSAINQATQQVIETKNIHVNQRPAIHLFLDAW